MPGHRQEATISSLAMEQADPMATGRAMASQDSPAATRYRGAAEGAVHSAAANPEERDRPVNVPFALRLTPGWRKQLTTHCRKNSHPMQVGRQETAERPNPKDAWNSEAKNAVVRELRIPGWAVALPLAEVVVEASWIALRRR